MDKYSKILSIITPAYNEEKNLLAMHAELQKALADIGMNWEWIIVDDHSADNTYQIASNIAKTDFRVRVFRLSRNFGSHVAIRCGLHYARGIVAVGLAADLQDPPAFVPSLLNRWREGNDVVWAVRNTRLGESFFHKMGSRLYYWIMHKWAGLKNMPLSGADFFLIDRKVIDALLRFEEGHISIFALLSWLGFKQDHLIYDKQSRREGRSGWTLGKKIKLVIDSIISHSYTPIRAFSIMGFIIACCGFIYALIILFNALFRVTPVPGWASLMVALLIIGGLQMIMLGVLGEYLWRALEQSRKRPAFLIEAQTDETT